jgi:cyclase
MPLTYGGGIRSLTDIERLLKLGIEKVSINTALRKNAQLLKDAVTQFGSSTVVLSIDIKKNWLGNYQVYDYVKGQITKDNLDNYLYRLNESEVGEVLVNAVDKDGTMSGYDFNLAERVSSHLNMPVVFAGGCKDMADINKLLTTTAVSAAGVGSYFVFHGPHKAVLISYPDPTVIGNIYGRQSLPISG